MLIPGESEEEQADWFPDGKSILFDRHSPGTPSGRASRDICILNMTTREISVLPGSEGLKFSALSPTGMYASAQTEDARKLMLYEFRTRRWTELAAGHGIIRAFWTRDDSTVYYQDEYAGSEEPIFRIRIADRKVERVTRPKLDIPIDVVSTLLVDLTRDGSPVVALTRTNSDVYALDLDLP